MANLVSPFTIDALRSATGFESPGFTVGPTGTLTLTGNMSVGGNLVMGNSGTIQSGSSTLITPTSLGSAITSSNLTSVGTLTGLTVNGAVHLTGIVNISSTPVTGTINNVNIGTTIPGIGSFTELNITETIDFNPTTTGAIDNTEIGLHTPAAAAFTELTASSISTSNISIDSDVAISGKLSVGGTNIKSLAIAMSVALS